MEPTDKQKKELAIAVLQLYDLDERLHEASRVVIDALSELPEGYFARLVVDIKGQLVGFDYHQSLGKGLVDINIYGSLQAAQANPHAIVFCRSQLADSASQERNFNSAYGQHLGLVNWNKPPNWYHGPNSDASTN